MVSRYIELNPLRAAIVEHPAQYPWSSYHGNVLDKPIKLLTAHQCYKALGDDVITRKKAYLALFTYHISELTLSEIRDATNKAWVLGDNKFKQQIEQQAGRRAAPLVRGGDRKSVKYKNQQL